MREKAIPPLPQALDHLGITLTQLADMTEYNSFTEKQGEGGVAQIPLAIFKQMTFVTALPACGMLCS